MKKQVSKKFNKTLVFTIVIMALFITIISIEIITVTLNNKTHEKILDKYIPNVKSYKYYSIDDNKFNEVNVLSDALVGDMCTDGCNLKVNYKNKKYYYMITYNKESYHLSLIIDNRVIVSRKNIGTNITDSYFRDYMGYLAFYNKIDADNYEYDYVLVSDKNSNIDEFTSLNSGELEFTDEGIIYYYDECGNGTDKESQKIKAIREPFNISPKVLDRENVEFSWC